MKPVRRVPTQWTTVQHGLRSLWPIAQQTAAAAAAWLVAVYFAGHADPFFAPVAAIVGLNATLGRRGSNALRLLTGVVIGVFVGQLAVWLLGGGVWTLALASFFAMVLARTVDAARIVQAQAAVSAVLVAVLNNPERGWERIIDAVIGAAVALTFSQLLFPPNRSGCCAARSRPSYRAWLTAFN